MTAEDEMIAKLEAIDARLVVMDADSNRIRSLEARAKYNAVVRLLIEQRDALLRKIEEVKNDE